MYGLPQAGLLANELLEKRLNKHGYRQSKLVPGLWKHDTRPIQFTLVVDDFGVKYVGEEHAQHLKTTLEEHYKLTCDWTGTRYIGITLDWDYNKRQVHLSMPNYVKKALKQFQHIAGKLQHSPYPSVPIQLGGTQFSSRQFIFRNHKKIRPKFHVTCLVDSHENKSLFTSPPSIWRCTLPPPLHALSPPCVEESIDLSTLEHAASPGECSNAGQFFYFVLLAAQHRANHNAR